MSYEPEPIFLPEPLAVAPPSEAQLARAAALVGPRLSRHDWEAFDAGLLPEWAMALVRHELGRVSAPSLFLALTGWRAREKGELQ